MGKDDWLWGNDREGTERNLRGDTPKYTWGNANADPPADRRGRPSDGSSFSFYGPDGRQHEGEHGTIWYGKMKDDRGRRRHVYARASEDHVEVHDEPAWWDFSANAGQTWRERRAARKAEKWQRIADGEPTVREDAAEMIGDSARMVGGTARNMGSIVASILFGRRHF